MPLWKGNGQFDQNRKTRETTTVKDVLVVIKTSLMWLYLVGKSSDPMSFIHNHITSVATNPFTPTTVTKFGDSLTSTQEGDFFLFHSVLKIICLKHATTCAINVVNKV